MTSAPLAEPAQAFPPALTALEPATLDLLRRHNLLRALVEKEVVAQAVASVVVSDEERAQAVATYRELVSNGKLNTQPAAQRAAERLTALGAS